MARVGRDRCDVVQSARQLFVRARWTTRCVVALMAIVFTTPAIAAGATRSVLAVYSSTRVLPATVEADRSIREVLEDTANGGVELYTEYLDIPRFGGDAYARTMASFLREKYSSHPPEVIIAGGEDVLEFLLRYRALLFPGVPLVHAAIETSYLRSMQPLPADVVGTPIDYDCVGTIQLAFRLDPKARHLVLVTGASDWDRRWSALLRSEAARFPARAKPEFLSGLTTEAVSRRLSELGRDSVVFTPGYFKDGAGRVFTPRDSMQILVAASKAPIYAPLKPLIGTGVVGGYVIDYTAVGRLAGRTAKHLLDGAKPETLHLPASLPAVLNLDWRQFRRWGIDERAIPRDAVVQFREPTLLEQYRSEVTIAAVAFLLQAALIIGLLLERRRRRGAESVAQARLLELAHMNRRVAMGGLAASIAHELNQPLGAIYNNAGAARMLIKASPPRLDEIAEILEDIQQDDKRASDVITRIRAMLSKTRIDVIDLDLNEAIGGAMKMLAADAATRGVSLKADLASGLPAVHADRVQVQQVVLNLAINAMESMSDRSGAKREVVVKSRRAGDADAEVSVTDSGAGIPPDILPRIFDPFVTSKPSGMGLGLSISRTIVEAHGGTIRAENLPQDGAVFRFTLPFATMGRA
jgi:signal transduction histidine kinase